MSSMCHCQMLDVTSKPVRPQPNGILSIALVLDSGPRIAGSLKRRCLDLDRWRRTKRAKAALRIKSNENAKIFTPSKYQRPSIWLWLVAVDTCNLNAKLFFRTSLPSMRKVPYV